MSVFISYSSKDSDFVDKVANSLVENRISIWLDRWEMKPGDSLVNKIQDGLTESDFLLVVLSKHSVESEWCKKELNFGLMREIDQKRPHVIPIKIDDCQIPAFLIEKKYADFRGTFSEGLNELLRPLSSLLSEHMYRRENEDFIIDFGLNWGILDGKYFLAIDLISWHKKEKKSILIQLNFIGDKKITLKFHENTARGHPWLMKETILQTVCNSQEMLELRMLLETDRIYYRRFNIGNRDGKLNVTLRALQMGTDNNMNILIDLLEYLNMLNEDKKERIARDIQNFGLKP